MTSRAKILFVGAGPAQAQAIRHAAKLGYVPYAADADPRAAGFGDAAAFDVGDIRDPEFIVDCARRRGVQAIVAIATDVSVPAVARACASLGLPAIPVEAADISVNKLMQRNRLRAAGLRVPQYMPFNNAEEACRNAARIGFPVVVKPSDAAGSRGVSLVQDERDVISSAEEALEVSRSKTGLVEEYVKGAEISVEGFVVEGAFHAICLSEKTRTPPPYLLDTAVFFPDTLSREERASVLALASDAVAACGFNTCPVHMEILRSPEGPVVVELAARGAGFKVFTNILPYVTGVDTVDAQLRLALGEKAVIAAQEPLKGAVIAFLSPVAGKLMSIGGLDRARQVQGVQEAEVYLEPGAVMGELRCGADRIGHLIVFGESRQEAEKHSMQAMSLIKLEVE